MSDTSDQSEEREDSDDSYCESDESENEEDDASSEDNSTEEQSMDLTPMLEEMSHRTRSARRRAAKNSDDATIGLILMEDLRELCPANVEQEAFLIAWARHIVDVVNGNSDNITCFSGAVGFFQLIINQSYPKTVYCIVKACAIVFSTEQSSDHLETGWAIAATKRCAQWIKAESTQSFTSVVLDILIQVKKTLRKVAEAGFEFQDIIKADTALKDSLAGLNLLLQQPIITNSVFPSTNDVIEAQNALVLSIRQETLWIEVLVSDTAEKVIHTLQQCVNSAQPSTDIKDSDTILFEAYNALCEPTLSTLTLQTHTAQGPLVALVVYVLQSKDGCKHLNLVSGALNLCQLLLQPWNEEDSDHILVKQSIARSLIERNILFALLTQLHSWCKQNTMYPTISGGSLMYCLLQFAHYTPSTITEYILPDTAAVAFIRYTAECQRVHSGGGGSKEKKEGAYYYAVSLVALIDGAHVSESG